ncbi:MAG: trehalose-6-phosphate synthase [Gammaproteobacteria bacterium]|nr:trehalose-6-phosphate synthase [Gammaproteobacteria bacterium]
MSAARIVVVANRLPVSVEAGPAGPLIRPSDGGLVAALGTALRHTGGTWVGWPGTGESSSGLLAQLAGVGDRAGFALDPVFLTPEQEQGFYAGFANEVIWPLFHDQLGRCNFDPAYWDAYQEVTARYSARVAAVAEGAGLVWVHDYHLISLGERLRSAGVTAPLAFFLHIPFPSPDVFVRLPWRTAILRAFLAYDLVGFQTPRDRRNFLDCLRLLLPDITLTGRGQPVVRVNWQGREVRIGRFPIGVDYADFAARVAEPAVVEHAANLRDLLPNRQLLLGVDRLDYTKGIPERLLAFADALERYPELRQQVTLIQVVVPSRDDIPQYASLKHRIENLVGEINGRFTHPGGWVPIHYLYRRLEPTELLAYYRAADVALVTPLKDGMNLVAKEYCACSPDGNGVLVLSEFAGVAAEMRQAALLVNPHAVRDVADAIERACAMRPAERQRRMRALRRLVRRHDVHWWLDSFLRAAIARDLSAFPQPLDHQHGGPAVAAF